VTRRIEPRRLRKFVEKVTAYYGTELGVDLRHAVFTLKLKEVRSPMIWEKDLRRHNLQTPWRDVGVAIWRDRVMRLDLSEDLERLSADPEGGSSAPPPDAG
jgi:hypothetical protein